MKTAGLIVNGKITDYPKIAGYISACDYIVAADGGANFLYDMKITPDYIIGDMDSIKANVFQYYTEKGVKTKKYPPQKDWTDSEIALKLLKELNYKKIHMFGAYGDRADHFLSNLDMLYLSDSLGLELTIVDENWRIFLVKEGTTIIGVKSGQTVSFNSISGNVSGITLKGFKYPLSDYTLYMGNSRMTSNIAEIDSPGISIAEGSLLCTIIDEKA